MGGMSNQKPEPKPSKSPEPQRVPIVNRRRGVVVLTYSVEREQNVEESILQSRETKQIQLPPGLSIMPESTFAAVGGDGALAQFGSDLSVYDPCQADAYAAVEIAKRTGSRQALNWWKDREKRPQVVEAIQARLDAPKPKRAA